MPADGAINRTLRILVTVAEGGPQTLTELSEKTGLAPPTLLRSLRLIREEGFVTQGADRKWRPTMLMWRLGCAVNTWTTPRASVDQTLTELAEAIDETVVYAGFEDGWLTYMSTVEAKKPIRTHIPLGGHYRALDTVTGHAVLAWLRRTEIDTVLDQQARPRLTPAGRQQIYRDLAEVATLGYATGTGDRWPGVWGASAPVFDQSGKPVGAVGTSVASTTVPGNATSIAQEVQAAARRLTQLLGGEAPARSPLLR